MYVCICKGITDQQIKTAVSGGAHSLQQVSRELGVSSQCGQCASLAAEIVADAIVNLNADIDFYEVA